MSYRGRGRGGFNNSRGGFNNSRGGFQNQNQQQNNPQNINQFLSSNAVPVSITGWNGASMEDCVKFISRKCRIVLSNPSIDSNTGALTGYVKSTKEADDLCNWSGVKFAGQSLKITKSFTQTSSGTGNTTIETITEFLKSRYDPQFKLLNLNAVQQDPTLMSKGFFANISTTSKFFPALMKIANEIKIDVESIVLSNNNLQDLTTISTLSVTFPKLKNLSLENNAISKLRVFETWRHKLNFLRELVIVGNPILNQTNASEIKTELMKSFPRLIVVNGEPLRNEQMLNEIFSFPYPNPQPMFFLDDEVQGMSTNFIANYIQFWDNNRSELMQLYQPESQFSLSVDMSHPHPIDGSTNDVDFGYYLPLSRNLAKISAPKARMSKLCIGQEQIYKAFTQLPKTKHELMSKPELFSMESYRVPQVNGFVVQLHGEFLELSVPDNLDAYNNSNNNATHNRNRFHNNRNKKVPLSAKSFDRSLIVIPGPGGSMIIASDSMVIRNPTGPDAWHKVKPAPVPASSTPTPVPQTPPNSGTPAPLPGAPVAPGVSAPSVSPVPGQPMQPGAAPVQGPTAADLPPDIKQMLNQMQQEMLVKVLLETHLNLQYGLMLCQQSNWDYQQCIINFKSSVSSLPREAYA